jgi:Chlorophyll A-B binding protein
MMATTGIVVQELLGKGNWWEAGAAKYDMDFLPLLAIEFVIMSFFETKRYIGFKETGSVRLRCSVSLPSLPSLPSVSLPSGSSLELYVAACLEKSQNSTCHLWTGSTASLLYRVALEFL